MRFDPYAIREHYSLDRACQLVQACRPRSVQICTRDLDVTLAVVRRLHALRDGLVVLTPELADAVEERLGIAVGYQAERPDADVAIVPFAIQDYATPPDARFVVAVAENRLSYVSLLRPRQIVGTSVGLHRWLGQTHTLQHSVGMLTPPFIARWALSLAAGTRWPELHFRLGQQALDRIYTTSPLRWVGAVCIASGVRR
jgi:hypothetical protein